MVLRLLKNTSKVLLIFGCSLITLPVSASLAQTAGEYPFHIGKTIEKEMTYSNAFEDLWEAVLEVLEDMDKETNKILQEKKTKSLKINTSSDKNSGLIIHYTTHMGGGGFFSGFLPAFTAHVFFLKPVEDQRTQVFYHRINYILYNQAILNDMGQPIQGAFARRLFLTPVEETVLKNIENKLKEKANEK